VVQDLTAAVDAMLENEKRQHSAVSDSLLRAAASLSTREVDDLAVRPWHNRLNTVPTRSGVTATAASTTNKV